MNQPNPYDPPRESIEPAGCRPDSSGPVRSRRYFHGTVLGAFAGVAFQGLALLLPAEGLLWMRGRRGKIPTRLGTGIAVALTILGAIAGYFVGRAHDRQAARRRR